MAWTAPMTAVANAVFTAAQFNTHVRDNLLETAPGKATTAGGYFVSTGANAIAERTVGSASVNTSQATTSTTFTDLATVGPTVSISTGTSALVVMSAEMTSTTSSVGARVGVDISGASTIAVDANQVLRFEGSTAGGEFNRASLVQHVTGLTVGTNIFTLKYSAASAGTVTYNFRNLIVLPL